MAQKLRRNVKDSKTQDPFSSLFVFLVVLPDLDAVDKPVDQPMASDDFAYHSILVLHTASVRAWPPFQLR